MKNVIADQYPATTGGPRSECEERKTKEYRLPVANAVGHTQREPAAGRGK